MADLYESAVQQRQEMRRALRRLYAENQRLREALEGLIDAGQHPATIDGLGHGYTLSTPFVTALAHAREALEATDEG